MYKLERINMIKTNCIECNAKLTHNDKYNIKSETCLKCRKLKNLNKMLDIRTKEIEDIGYKVIKLEQGNANNSYPCTVECTNCGKVRTTYYRNIVVDGRKCSCLHSEHRQKLIDSIQVKPVLLQVGSEFKVSGIYRIDVGNEFYIGSSNNVQNRLRTHIRDIRDKRHTIPMLKACEKYGTDSIKLSLLEECSIKELAKREQFYIDTLKPTINILEDAENPMQDIKLKFAKIYGENSSSSKTSNKDILRVASMLVENRDMRYISEVTGVSYHAITGLSIGKSYCWVKDVEPELYDRIMMMKGARLGYTTIVSILEELTKDREMKSIAKEFNVDWNTVQNIKECNKEVYKRIKERDVVASELYKKLENNVGGV